MKILEKKQSELLPRIEVSAEIDHTAKSTPSKETIRESLANELKTDKEFIVIKNIYSKFGESKSKLSANIYTDKNSLTRLELSNKKPKKKQESKPKKQEK